MTKFKVGDKVRLIRKPTYKDIKTCYVNQMDVLEVGDIGDVLDIRRDVIFVKFNKLVALWYAKDILELVTDKPWLSDEHWGYCYDWSKAKEGLEIEIKYNLGYEIFFLNYIKDGFIHFVTNKSQIKICRDYYDNIEVARPHFYADRKRMWKGKEKEYTLQELVGKDVLSIYDNKTIFKIEYLSENGFYLATIKHGASIINKDEISSYTFADGSPIRIKHD